MSEFPEQIYITEPKTYSDGETIPGTWVTKRDWCFKHEYRRVDLPPTPAQVTVQEAGMSEYRLSAMDPDKIDELRFKAFKTNIQEDKMAYYREASAYFQDRHVRALIRAELTAANKRAAASVEAVARANAERDESLNQLDSVKHSVDVLEKRVANLMAERDALVAAAYEAAAEFAFDWFPDNDDASSLSMNIRALTPANAAAALDRIKAEARAEALREAAEIADENLDRVQPHVVDGVMEDETAQGYGNAAINIAHSILALLDTPAPAQPSVQEAARVLLDQPYGVMSGAFDAMEKLHGEGADRIMAAALRAIAGGGDE